MSTREDAFRALFAEQWPAVYSYARRRVGDAGEAEEIAADVFRIAWEKQDPANPFGRPWLFRTAMNRLRDHYRRRSRRAKAEAALQRRIEEAPARAEVEDLLALRVAMKFLSEREREAVLLTYWEGLSAAEVGAVLGCAPGTVWTLMTRAREKLRVAMRDTAPVEGGRP
ncbi:RNA polymerase sigma factor [Microbacterium sulfonylureivorans]|uniref:RNA polymerase sigma factor n=1 Tax=Microbacterium sulfonylureivorans TaxID=2486854 RepID=UPI000FDC21D8|nr:sigma-70 family RNA polymerase sigma factor [Microbacterium sulfonylureivorans]